MTSSGASTVTVTTTAIPEATVTFTSPVETATADASQNGTNDNGSAGASNKAWVAGAVIGAVAALGLVGLAFWYGRRRAMESRGAVGAGSAVAGAGAGAGAGVAGPGPGPGPQHNHMSMGSVATNSTHTAPVGYAPYNPGQHQPPLSAVSPYYSQGTPGANQYASPAQQQNTIASYWAAKEYPHSVQSTPLPAEPPSGRGMSPGNAVGYYAPQASPDDLRTHHTGVRSELGDA